MVYEWFDCLGRIIVIKPKRITKGTVSKYVFIGSLLIYPAILFAIFYVYVNFNSILLSFQEIDFAGNKSFNGLKNFASFFREIGDEESIIRISLLNSIKMWATNLAICMPLYIIFSYYVFKKWTGTGIFRALIMLPSIMSSFVVCLLFKKFVEQALPTAMLELFNVEKFPNLIREKEYQWGTTLFYMIWISFATSVIVYSNAMKEIDNGIFEAAKIDGVNVAQEIFYIVIPLIMPTITTFVVTGVTGIFSSAGVLVAFYEYSAGSHLYIFGYLIIQRTMTKGEYYYPVLAAMGIVMTLVMTPITLGVKALLEKLDPTGD